MCAPLSARTVARISLWKSISPRRINETNAYFVERSASPVVAPDNVRGVRPCKARTHNILPHLLKVQGRNWRCEMNRMRTCACGADWDGTGCDFCGRIRKAPAAPTDGPPWNLSPVMLKHRAVCSYAQAVLDALPDSRGKRSPAAVAWVEVAKAYVESFDEMQ